MKYLVLGATSTIARSLVLQLARRGDEFLLGARDVSEGQAVAADLAIRTGAQVLFEPLEATACSSHAAWMENAIGKLHGLDGVILCFGELPRQADVSVDWPGAQRVICVNFAAAVALLEPAAEFLERQRHGFILALSSVAGVRGRKSNYLYGASKAALTVFLEGLAHRLSPSGVRVKIALLGYVESRMSAGVPIPEPLRTTADAAARKILRFLKSNAQSACIPWFWGPIMCAIRLLPARVFNKTEL
ncbi:MAG TPA: SDR family NAD(P)-dependent oxidoreductase [Chthoniobacter sp.]|jgi:NAD(P)-dependent dehydrogenase (short-subunit alcohol dehydrogenase family)